MALAHPLTRSRRPEKYTDGQGRTRGGMGQRPDWFKAALRMQASRPKKH